MGLQHSVAVTYGFELPKDIDLDRLDAVIGDGPDLVKDSVGHHVIGDYERLLLCTRFTQVEENQVLRLGWSLAEPAELATWEEALHAVALRLGYPDHPAPAWLAVHNYR